MRIKFLSVIVSFLFVSFAVTSCLNSDETYAYSTDATIHAFGIDTIHGKYYKFTIDQLNNTIFNHDSLPVGSDTIIDRILIETLVLSGWATSGTTDTLFVMADSVDLRNPLELKVHAPDGLTNRKYTIKVNVHKQVPDSLDWGNKPVAPFLETPIVGKQKTIILGGNQLFVYTSNTVAYKTSTKMNNFGWTQLTVKGLPSNIQLASIVNSGETLYMTSADGKVFRSIEGSNWEEATLLSNQVVTLITSIPNIMDTNASPTLVGIRSIDGENYFCTATGDLLSWVTGEKVPANFPTSDFYTTVYKTDTGIMKAVLVGNIADKKAPTTPWFSLDGLRWASLGTTSDAFCPGINNPFIMHYGGDFYISGGEFTAFYKSAAGIAWYKTQKNFLLKSEFKGKTAYSMAIDQDNFIWIVFGGNGTTNEVWRGRLNKLGFLIQ